MFVNSTITVGVTQRVVATLVACAMVMASIGVYQTAHAANLTLVSNTLSTSEPNVASANTILFTATNDIGPAENITITWDSQDDGGAGQDFGGIAAIDSPSTAANILVDVNGASAPAAAAPTFVSADADSLEINGVTATAGQTVEIEVAVGAGIINPTTLGSYEIEIAVANTENDIGRTRVVIIDQVEVTAIVATTFDFVISPVNVGTSVGGENTTGSSSTTTIPFGVLDAGTPEFIAQQLNVTTNAAGGFVVTVEKDSPLESSTGADIDEFTDSDDGLGSDTPAAWAQPDGNLSFGENGWGHWGMVAVDNDLQGAGTAFSADDQYIAVPNTPRAVFAHNGPTDGLVGIGGPDTSTDDVGQTFVGYKVEITPLQEAGDDYNTTLTYIATPSF